MRKKISFAYIYKQKNSATYEQLLVQGPVSLALLLQNETFLLLAWWVRSSLWCHLWFAFLGFCWLPCYTNIMIKIIFRHLPFKIVWHVLPLALLLWYPVLCLLSYSFVQYASYSFTPLTGFASLFCKLF